jgi:hypothetical protein
MAVTLQLALQAGWAGWAAAAGSTTSPIAVDCVSSPGRGGSGGIVASVALGTMSSLSVPCKMVVPAWSPPELSRLAGPRISGERDASHCMIVWNASLRTCLLVYSDGEAKTECDQPILSI